MIGLLQVTGNESAKGMTLEDMRNQWGLKQDLKDIMGTDLMEVNYMNVRDHFTSVLHNDAQGGMCESELIWGIIIGCRIRLM